MPDALLFDAEALKAAVFVPDRQDMFFILAYGDGVWSIPSTLRHIFNDQASAERAAAHLSPHWHHVRVVRIPGEKGHFS